MQTPHLNCLPCFSSNFLWGQSDPNVHESSGELSESHDKKCFFTACNREIYSKPHLACFFSSLCLLLTVIKEFSIDLTLNSCNIMMDIQTNSSSRIRYTLHSLVPTLPIMPRELWQFGQRFGCGMLVAASLELLSSEKDEEVWLHTSFLWMVQFPNIGSCFSDIGVFISRENVQESKKIRIFNRAGRFKQHVGSCFQYWRDKEEQKKQYSDSTIHEVGKSFLPSTQLLS